MNSPGSTLKGESFFQGDQLIYVNRAEENYSLPLHDHDFIEIAYIAEGSGYHHILGEVHKVSKGQLFVLPIGVSHVLRPASANPAVGPLIVYNCLFHPLLLDQLAGFVTDDRIRGYLLTLKHESSSYYAMTDRDDSLERLYVTMHREFSLPRDGSADFLMTLLLQLLIHIARNQQGSEEAPQSKLADFGHLLTYMEQHCSRDLTLDELARMSHWSKRQLQRMFNRYTGQPFNRYLQYLRMQKSCELLRNTKHKISLIAELVGYKDMGAFLSVFKRNVGMTPSGYRRGL